MITKQFIYGLAIVAGVGLIYSCDANLDKDSVSMEEATALVVATNTAVKNAASDIKKEPASDVMKELKRLLPTSKLNAQNVVRLKNARANASTLKYATGVSSDDIDYLKPSYFEGFLDFYNAFPEHGTYTFVSHNKKKPKR